MVLRALEFTDCLSDSPWFRQNLHEHENALDEAYKNIKSMENQCRDLINCTKKLSLAQRSFAKSLAEFKIETVGSNQTDDEQFIAKCLKEFAKMINQVEDERMKVIDQAEDQYLEPLKRFRTEAIGRTLNEEKRKYEKESSKFYSTLEKHLHLSTVRKNDFREADAQLEFQQKNFFQSSLQYVAEIQSVQERMKFEFVETISSFVYSWLTFYHVGNVIHEDFKPFLDNVQTKVQKTKDSYTATITEAEELKRKMLASHTKSNCAEGRPSSTIKQGYVYMQEKGRIPKTIGRDVLGKWTKYYCVYSKETRIFTMLSANTATKTDMKSALNQSVQFKLRSCSKRPSDSIDKRFCFDVCGEERTDVLTLQALSEDDVNEWIDAMDSAKTNVFQSGANPSCSTYQQTQLDEVGFEFVQQCIDILEENGIHEQGVYRNCGVTSKVQKLMQLGLDRRKAAEKGGLNLRDDEWETKTISSAFKTFLRNLPEPLMTFELHGEFITAAKMGDASLRVDSIHFYVHMLPAQHKKMLDLVISHLKRVADLSSENLMTVSNLGVCFGPTLLRPKEETVAAIMDIKFCNVVVEVLISNYDKIFKSEPRNTCAVPPKPEHSSTDNSQQHQTDNGRGFASSAASGGALVASRPQSVYSNPSPLTTRSRSPKGTGIGQSKIVRNTQIVSSSYSKGMQQRHAMYPADLNRSGVAFDPTNVVDSTTSTWDRTSPVMSPTATIAAVSVEKDDEERLTGARARNSSDSLNSLGSVGSTGGGTGSADDSTATVVAADYGKPAVKTKYSVSYAPTYNRIPPESFISVTASSLNTSVTSAEMYKEVARSGPPLKSNFIRSIAPPVYIQPSRRVKTLYACTPDHDSELSFEPGQIITNVYESKEDGWLVGTLNGKTGLIPSNYVEPLP